MRGDSDAKMVIPVGSLVCLKEGQYANILGVVLRESQSSYEIWLDRLRIVITDVEDNCIALALRYVDDYHFLF
jgi:hypothetical protein